MRHTLRPWLPRAALVSASLFLGACLPITLPGTSTTPPCPEGTFHITDQVLSGLVPTSLGNVQLTLVPGGNLALSVTASSWSLAGSQSLTVSGITPWGPVSGTASVTVNASGSWTKTSSTQLNFTVGSVSGSGTFTGTVSGASVSRTASLADLGLDRVYGLSGSATYGCGSAPSLTLTFTSARLELHRD